jgi:hypothetical protein
MNESNDLGVRSKRENAFVPEKIRHHPTVGGASLATPANNPARTEESSQGPVSFLLIRNCSSRLETGNRRGRDWLGRA